MFSLVKALSVLPEIYRGRFVDIDREVNLAYEKYPFPWPSEKPYSEYSPQDISSKRDESIASLRVFLREFRVIESTIKDKVVFDLGAGVGWDAMALASCGAKQVYAFDNSSASVAHGQRFAECLGLKNVTYVRTSLYEVGDHSQGGSSPRLRSTSPGTGHLCRVKAGYRTLAHSLPILDEAWVLQVLQQSSGVDARRCGHRKTHRCGHQGFP
jgi:hypothetical protein